LKKLAQNNDKTIAKHIFILTKEISMDEEEEKYLLMRKQIFCSQALNNYFSCLRSSEQYNEHAMSRFISLWFSNIEITEINTFIKVYVC
jgi:hypothetical protein